MGLKNWFGVESFFPMYFFFSISFEDKHNEERQKEKKML